MSKIETITAAETRFPLASLSLSPMNPRQHVPESDVIELAESIWSAGLIQNIAGLDDGKGNVEIVAGGRRLRALQYLASQHPDFAKTRPELANPLVMLAPDAFTAEAWGNMENVARRDLHPAEEVRAYGKMEAKGATPSLIARAFAVTEKHVYRRLALANLPEPIIEALAEGEITLSAAACFTISDDEKRSYEVLQRVRGNDYSEFAIKTMLKPDAIRGTDRSAIFVGEDAYREAGGRIGGDLFAEVALFDDLDILETLFAERLNAEVTRISHEQGWKWVESDLGGYICSYSKGLEKYGRFYPVEGDLSEEQSNRYDELADLAEADALDAAGEAELQALQTILNGDYTPKQKAHGGAFIHVGSDGELKVTGGFVKPADCKAAVKAGVLAENKHVGQKDAPKSPISAKLANDLSCIALGARQHALLRDPDLMLDLFA